MMIFGNLYTVQEFCLPTLAIRWRFSRLKEVTKKNIFSYVGQVLFSMFSYSVEMYPDTSKSFFKKPLAFSNSSITVFV